MSTATAVVVAVAAWIGAVLGAYQPHWGPGFVAVNAGAITVIAVTSLWRPDDENSSRHRRRASARTVACIAVVFATAAVSGAVREQAISDGPLARRLVRGTADTSCTATVTSDPQVSTSLYGRSIRHFAKLEQCCVTGRCFTSSETVLLRFGEDQRTEPFGSTITVQGWATIDRSAFMHRNGTVTAFTVNRSTLVRPPPVWVSTTNTVRRTLRTVAQSRLPEDDAALFSGLVTGDVSGISTFTADRLRTAGLSHLVAVSGSNVAMFLTAVVGILLTFSVSRRTALVCSVPTLLWFVVLVRGDPSVVRAAIMATVVITAQVIGRVTVGVHLVAVTVWLAVLFDPLLTQQLGFVLSVLAVASIVVGHEPIRDVLERYLSLPAAVSSLIAVTISAQIGVSPVLWWLGQPLHPVTVVANGIAVPTAGVVSLIGQFTAVVGLVHTGAASLLAGVCRPGTWLILHTAQWALDPTAQRVATVGTVGFVVYQVASQRGWLRPLASVAPLGAVAVIATVFGATPFAEPTLPPRPVLVMLDVGQGDALLLGDPQAGWLLVDGGLEPDVLLPQLDDAGVDRLSAVLLTHADADHAGGVPAAIRDRSPTFTYIGPLGDAARDVVDAAGSTRVDLANDATVVHGTMTLRVLSPPPTGIAGNVNESSVVVRVDTAQGRSALLTGDVEFIGQRVLMGGPYAALLDVDVLKVPHHGAATNAPQFLTATSPSTALISVGESNQYGHPHRDTIDELRDVDAEIRRSDIDGTVWVYLDTGETTCRGPTDPCDTDE